MNRKKLHASLVIVFLLAFCLAASTTMAAPVTFKFYSADGSAAVDDGFNSPVAKAIEAEIGVRLQLDYPIGSAGVDKLQLMVASGDYPDLIFAKGDLNLLKDAGALVPLDDLIEKYAPNLKAAYGNNLNRLRWSHDDPTIYCLGAWGTGPDAVLDVGGGFMIQHRVVQELGYPTIRTIEDFEKAITEYYKLHPTTDGLPTIPLTLIAEDWRTVISVNNPAFQATGAPDDGEYYVNPETLEVISHYKRPIEREYFRWLNHLWNEGVLDRETFVQKYDTYKAKIATGRVLALIDADWDIGEPLAALRQSGTLDRMYGRYPVTVSEDVLQCPPDVDTGYTGGWGIAITKACKDPVKAIQFLDWMVTEEACVLRYWGIEGEHYTYDENGKRVFLPEVEKARNEDPAFSRKTGVNLYGYPFPRLPNNHIDKTGNEILPDMHIDDIRAKYTDVEKEVLANYGVNIWKDLFPTRDTYPSKTWGYLWMYSIDDPDIEVINSKIWDYTLKTVPQIVMAPVDKFDKAYDDFLAGLDNLGVQKVEQFYTDRIRKNVEFWSE